MKYVPLSETKYYLGVAYNRDVNKATIEPMCNIPKDQLLTPLNKGCGWVCTNIRMRSNIT